MIGRSLLLVAYCSAAIAQLPPPQAPMPRTDTPQRERRKGAGDEKETARVDAVVTDLKGSSIPGLTAADFTLEADGKPEKIVSSVYRTDQPLRLAVIFDDLSLPAEKLDRARLALRGFISSALDPQDQAAILHTGNGEGSLDGFTSDRAALNAAIDRARHNPAAEEATPETFTAGSLGALRGVLEGMREIPGRKMVLFISERLRDPARGGQPAWTLRLTNLANLGSTVFYAVDMNAAQQQTYTLEQGLALVAKDTGGFLVEGGDVAKALARIAQDQAGHYVITYNAEDLADEFIPGRPRVGRVAVKVNRPDTVVRARNGVFGRESEGGHYREPDREFERALGSDLVSGEMRLKLTGLLTMAAAWQAAGVFHVDARDITFVQGLDGVYRTRIDAALSLLGENGATEKSSARALELALTGKAFEDVRAHGFDFTVVVPIPKAGPYQLRAAVRDTASGRIGSAREFVRLPVEASGKLGMSSIILHGDTEKAADGSESPKDPEETVSQRNFKAGHRVIYSYYLYNVAADDQKRSTVEVQTRISRDGAPIFSGEPTTIHFPAIANPGSRGAGGIIRLHDTMAPGHYLFHVTVTDKITPRTVSQFMDFDVHP